MLGLKGEAEHHIGFLANVFYTGPRFVVSAGLFALGHALGGQSSLDCVAFLSESEGEGAQLLI